MNSRDRQVYYWVHMLDETFSSEYLMEDKHAFIKKFGNENAFKPVFNKYWDNIRHRLNGQKKDIEYWQNRDWSEFKDFVSRFDLDKNKSERREEECLTKAKNNGARLLDPDFNGYEIWYVGSWEAARQLGRFYKGISAKWCVSTDNYQYFNSNYRVYEFLFFIRKTPLKNKFDKIAVNICTGGYNMGKTECWNLDDEEYTDYGVRIDGKHEIDDDILPINVRQFNFMDFLKSREVIGLRRKYDMPAFRSSPDGNIIVLDTEDSKIEQFQNRIEGEIWLRNLMNLKTLSGLPSSVEKSVTIDGLYYLETLEGIPSYIGKNLTIKGGDFKNMRGGIKHVGGNIDIQHCGSLESLEGLEQAENPYLMISWSKNLESLKGLPSRMQALNLYYCRKLKTLRYAPADIEYFSIEDTSVPPEEIRLFKEEVLQNKNQKYIDGDGYFDPDGKGDIYRDFRKNKTSPDDISYMLNAEKYEKDGHITYILDDKLLYLVGKINNTACLYDVAARKCVYVDMVSQSMHDDIKEINQYSNFEGCLDFSGINLGELPDNMPEFALSLKCDGCGLTSLKNMPFELMDGCSFKNNKLNGDHSIDGMSTMIAWYDEDEAKIYTDKDYAKKRINEIFEGNNIKHEVKTAFAFALYLSKIMVEEKEFRDVVKKGIIDDEFSGADELPVGINGDVVPAVCLLDIRKTSGGYDEYMFKYTSKEYWT